MSTYCELEIGTNLISYFYILRILHGEMPAQDFLQYYFSFAHANWRVGMTKKEPWHANSTKLIVPDKNHP